MAQYLLTLRSGLKSVSRARYFRVTSFAKFSVAAEGQQRVVSLRDRHRSRMTENGSSLENMRSRYRDTLQQSEKSALASANAGKANCLPNESNDESNTRLARRPVSSYEYGFVITGDSLREVEPMLRKALAPIFAIDAASYVVDDSLTRQQYDDVLERVESDPTLKRVFHSMFFYFCVQRNLPQLGDSFVRFALDCGHFPHIVAVGSAIRFYAHFQRHFPDVEFDRQPESVTDIAGQKDATIENAPFSQLADLCDRFPQPSTTFMLGQKLIALSFTKERWREGATVLGALKKANEASMSAFSCMISAACRAAAFDEAVRYLNEVSKRSLRLADNTMLDIVNASILQVGIAKNRQNQQQNLVASSSNTQTFPLSNENLLKTDHGTEHARLIRALLGCLRSSNQCMPENVCTRLSNYFSRIGWSFRPFRTDVSSGERGICPHCRGKLEKIALTDAQQQELAKSVMDKVILSNVFRATSPDELEKFLRYMDREKPFDLVIDGLNVMFFGEHRKRPQTDAVRMRKLISVVRYLADNFGFKKILVVLRKHAATARAEFNELKCYANYYLLDNISKDDPFAAFAAMKSSTRTYILTNDKFGDQQWNLAQEDDRLFKLWYRARNLQLVTPDGTAQRKDGFRIQPPTYRPEASASSSPEPILPPREPF